MKYSDQQRIEKMRETTEKLLRYVEKENITPERIFAEETVQWTVTTPLYNIGEHAANLSEDFKKQYCSCVHPDGCESKHRSRRSHRRAPAPPA